MKLAVRVCKASLDEPEFTVKLMAWWYDDGAFGCQKFSQVRLIGTKKGKSKAEIALIGAKKLRKLADDLERYAKNEI